MSPRLLVILLTLSLYGCDRNAPLTSTTPPPATLTVERLLEDARPSDSDDVLYSPPSLAERIALEQAMATLGAVISGGGVLEETVLKEKFAAAGLRTQLLADGDWIVLFEGGRKWRGTGVYVFRLKGEASDIVLQAPHGFHDRNTVELAWPLFRSVPVRALFFNTAHRYRSTPSGQQASGENRADLAHTTDSHFYLVTSEWLRSNPSTTVVQLHGFDDAELDVAGYDVVVSNGTSDADETVRDWTANLRGVFGESRVALYPDDVRAFGASSNTIGRLIRLTQRGKFVHLEMSAKVRAELVTNPEPLHAVFR